ncbi:MAG: class I SAM-dependent methyltransferase [Sedimentisphaerales bacterium]|nr:class I SAM-dependent methyltransferase [Sedimentisphaerales bacterium]
MKEGLTYRNSHTASSKGAQYDRRFREFAWRRYLWHGEKKILLEVLQKYCFGRPIRHLDFACGTGRILEFLSEYVHESTGVDVSESMLGQCRRKVPNAEIIQEDITRNDVLAGRKFDLITAFRFFPNAEHELRVEVIEALAWHLSTDGILVFNNHRNASSILFRLARALGKRPPCMTNQEVDDLAQSTRFRIEQVYSLGFLPGYDNHPMVLPFWIHNMFDKAANHLGMGKTHCQNNIYICRKVGHLSDNKEHAYEKSCVSLSV